MFKRILSVMLACTLVFWLAPSIDLNAYAAEANTLTGLTVDGLTVTYSNVSNNKGSSTWSGAGNAITGTATGFKRVISTSAVNSTVCFTNSSGADATLSFDYALENGGSVTKLSGGSYSGELKAGADFSVKLNSFGGSGDPQTTTLKITNIKLVPAGAAEANVIFKTGEGGTYTVNGTAVNGNTSFTNPAGTDYRLEATPNSGKQFLGWYNEATDEYVGYTSSYTFSPVADATIHPVFVDKSTAIFGVGAARFADLNLAAAAAASGGDKVVYLCNDGTLPAGNYTISEGVTLLVPYNDANSVHVDAKCTGLVDGGPFGFGNPVTYETPKAYRTLTMADGAVITVNGELNVGGKHSPGDASGRNYSGSPSGSVGMINMLKGSKIVVNNNSNLRCWGYIYGAGSVVAKSGATVHENFQFTDFRGGSVTSNMAANYKVFPLSQYYVQNVEVPVTYEYGAKAKVWTSIYMSKQIFSAGVDFIGVGAMFVPAEGGSIVKSYDPNTDRLTIDVNDGGSINPMSLELGGTKIKSGEFNLPINSNITVNLKAGTVYVNQSISLLPGAEVHVGKDATLELSAGTPSQSGLYTGAENLFVYSYDQWTKGLDGETFEEVDGYFVLDNLRLNPVKYTPTRTHNRTENDLKVGATLDINGTFIANGFLYSTKSGGNITSSEKTGKVIFNNGVGQDMFTAQAKQSGTNLSYIYIETVPAMLKNANASYTNTATAGEDEDGNPIFVTTSNSNAWAYCSKCDKWAPMVTISFNKGDGKGSMNAQSVTNCGCHKLNANKFTKEGYSFAAWKDAAGKTYTDEAVVKFGDNVTLTATFEEINKAVTVTWMVNGTSYQKEENKGDTPTCVVPEDKLAKASDATGHYTFKGWSYQENGSIIDNFAVVDNDITIYAVFDVANHKDTDDDHYCNDCSYKMSEHYYDESVWAKDADGHWHGCTLCGNKDAYAAHTGGTATCTKKAECSICGEQYGEKNANNHTKGKIWSVKNETQHKQEWECCHVVTVALENHDWVNGVCDDCEYVRLHTVNFDSDGGSDVSPKTDVKWSDKVLEGVTTPTAPKDGYVFNGWKFGDTAVTDNTTYGELAGQTATSITLKAQWKDVYAPTGEIKLGENKWTEMLNKITFGLFYKETKEFTITANDNSGENVEIKYFLSETALSDNEVESAEYVKYTGKVSLSPDQKVIVYAKLTDETGNTSYICSNGLVFDGIAPVVTGVTNGTTYCAAQTVKVTDDNLEKVTVNGNTVTLNADGQFTLNPTEGTQKIVAVDKAGNVSAEMVVTVKNGHFGGEATCLDKAVCEACRQPYGELKQHELTHINPNPANCINEGNIEYWNCSECKQNFADSEGTTVVNDVTIKVDSKNHTGNTICVPNASDNSKHDVKCSDCQQILRTEAHVYVDGKCQCETTQKITISFDTNGDGIIDETTQVDYDQLPAAPLNPEKSADDNFTYTFKAWNKELVKAHEDTTYTATFYRTGWLVSEGGRQYIEKDVPLTGWQTIAGKQFYFDNETKYAATGVVRVAYPEGFGPNTDDVAYEESHGREFKDKTTVLCVFNETTGAFKNDYTGIISYAGANRWASNGMIQWHPGLVAVSDDLTLDYYYFLGDSKLGGNKMVTGEQVIYRNNTTFEVAPNTAYYFGLDGKLMLSEDGVRLGEDGKIHYYKDGTIQVGLGLIEYNGSYIYVASNGVVCTGKVWVSKTNDLFSEGYYYFDETGKMIVNGIFADADGTLHYYVNGKIQYGAGLVAYGDSYIYVSSNGKVCTGEVWVSNTNGLVNEGRYTFGEDGKMLGGIKSGVFADNDGVLHYYVDGKLQSGLGLVAYEDSYIYVSSNGKVCTGKVWVSNTNGLVKEGWYIFDENGLMSL